MISIIWPWSHSGIVRRQVSQQRAREELHKAKDELLGSVHQHHEAKETADRLRAIQRENHLVEAIQLHWGESR